MYVNIAFLANMVSLLRAEIDGAVWLTDDEEEARFYERCAHPTARVVATQGAATDLLEMVASRRIEGVVASVCRDDTPIAKENVFRLSVGDVTSLLLISKGFEHAMNDIVGGPWLMASQKQVGSVLQRSVGIACVITALKNACTAESLNPPDFGDYTATVNWENPETPR